MRTQWAVISWTLCAWCAWQNAAHGQALPAAPAAPALPGVPSVAAPAAAAPAAAPATPAAPTGPNLWTFFCPPPGCCDKCKQIICSSFVGQFASSALAPVRMATGGMMKPCCPAPGTPNAADLAKDADSTAGAAARIKQDEADAKARRADVRYLGTVDCSRYPEAEKALIKALRTDHNECVRLEAALALGNGCCCTKATVEALLLTVNASDKDGNPSERSPRVKCAAADALAHCQGRVPDHTPEPPERVPAAAAFKQMPKSVPTASKSTPNLLPVAATSPMPTAVPASAQADNAVVPTGQRGVFQIFMRRVQSTPTSTASSQ